MVKWTDQEQNCRATEYIFYVVAWLYRYLAKIRRWKTYQWTSGVVLVKKHKLFKNENQHQMMRMGGVEALQPKPTYQQSSHWTLSLLKRSMRLWHLMITATTLTSTLLQPFYKTVASTLNSLVLKRVLIYGWNGVCQKIVVLSRKLATRLKIKDVNIKVLTHSDRTITCNTSRRHFFFRHWYLRWHGRRSELPSRNDRRFSLSLGDSHYSNYYAVNGNNDHKIDVALLYGENPRGVTDKMTSSDILRAAESLILWSRGSFPPRYLG